MMRASVEKYVSERQDALLEVNVSVGRCCDCPLKSSCREANDEDSICRLTTKAMAKFEHHAFSCGWILPEDMPGVRALGAIHASMILAEEFFRCYGSIVVKKGRKREVEDDEAEKDVPCFTPLHTQYVRLQEKFQVGLERYGLTPSGRRALRARVSAPSAMIALEKYVEANYEVRSARPARADGHRGVLPGPGVPEPAAPRDPGGPPPSDLRPGDDPGAAASLPGYDRRKVPVGG